VAVVFLALSVWAVLESADANNQREAAEGLRDDAVELRSEADRQRDDAVELRGEADRLRVEAEIEALAAAAARCRPRYGSTG
jgi:hypothetical protein